MRILVADKDESFLRTVELMLGAEKFNVYGIDSGEEAADIGKLYDYDCIVLGDTLDLERSAVIRQLRTARIKTPVLVLSGLSAVDDIVSALNAGADDYMPKPFHKDELVARIHALVRRSKGHAESVITTGPLVLNINTKTVTVLGQPVHLTGKEYAMLELLSLRKGMTLSKDAFLTHLYGGRDEPETKIIDVFICKLRKKLASATEGDGIIETVWGRGYVLRDPVTPNVASPSLAPELADLASETGVGFVPMRTYQDYKADERQRLWPSPSIVPAAGQR